MKDPVVQIKELAEQYFGAVFKAYYDGDPEVLPSFQLPCMIVTQTKDDTAEGEMGEDNVSDSIRIKLVFDKRDDFTGTVVKPVDLTESKLRSLTRAIDENGKYAQGTVKHMLRNNLLEGFEAIAPNMTIEFGINERPTLENDDNVPLTAEAWVTFPIQYSVDTY